MNSVSEYDTRPLVSVVMIFLNAERFMQEALDSLTHQTYDGWELLLVDDGSTDDSTFIAKGFVDAHRNKARYFEHDGHRNCGMSASRNLAIRNAKGKYISFLDADDAYNPTKLEEQVRILEQYPKAAYACGRSQRWHSWTGNPEDSDAHQNMTLPQDTLIAPPAVFLMWFKDEYAALTPDVMVRSDVARAVGGFEDSFRDMYEDQVFHAKLCLNYPGYMAGISWYRYRQHPSSTTSAATIRGWAASRREFLHWLRSYMSSHRIHHEEIEALIQQQRKSLWLALHPRTLRVVVAIKRRKQKLASLLQQTHTSD